MAVIPNSTATPWIRAAKRRWPNYSVSFDEPSAGRFAVINKSLACVHLFAFRMFAEAYASARPEPADLISLVEISPDWGCSTTHAPLRVTADRIERDR